MDKKQEIVPEYWKDLSLENIIYFNDEGIECEERWLPIKGYEGLYEVSDCGRVKSLERKRVWKGAKRHSIRLKILKQILLNTGYPKVSLSKLGIASPNNIHSLVANHFIPNPNNLPEVNHRHGVKKDNRKSELEWSTQYDNIIHAKTTGLDKAISETHYLTKFKNTDVVDIFLSEKTITELSKIYKVTIQCIWNIKNKKTWNSVTKELING